MSDLSTHPITYCPPGVAKGAYPGQEQRPKPALWHPDHIGSPTSTRRDHLPEDGEE